MASEETVTISRKEYDQLIGLKEKVAILNHQLADLKRLVYGSKRERFISSNDPAQGSLFNIPQEEDALEQKQQISYQRRKPKPKKQPLRLELPSHLPRREEIIIPENLPEGAIRIGEAVTEVLDYVPGKLEVHRIVRPKFIIGSNDEKTNIVIADLPSLPIPRGNAGSGLLAHILISKFVDHLPFYRQVQMFRRKDIHLAESTLNGWFAATCRLLEPLYENLKKQLLSSDYLMADETPLPVLTKDKPGATHKGYQWVYYSPDKRLVLFDYRKTRSREGPDDILKNYSGFLQTDGYEAYSNLKNKDSITLLACMAHARRYFDKAKDNDLKRAEHAMDLFQKLYAIEREAKQLQTDEIEALRQEKSIPVLNEMQSWLKDEIYNVTPKSAIGKAIAYTLKLWPRLIRYTQQGRFHIDNNLVENSIRPVALGRKNYLFAGSHDAAQYAAMIYSLLATCKINNIEPFQWLKHTLDTIPDHPANQLQELLPRE